MKNEQNMLSQSRRVHFIFDTSNEQMALHVQLICHLKTRQNRLDTKTTSHPLPNCHNCLLHITFCDNVHKLVCHHIENIVPKYNRLWVFNDRESRFISAKETCIFISCLRALLSIHHGVHHHDLEFMAFVFSHHCFMDSYFVFCSCA